MLSVLRKPQNARCLARYEIKIFWKNVKHSRYGNINPSMAMEFIATTAKDRGDLCL